MASLLTAYAGITFIGQIILIIGLILVAILVLWFLRFAVIEIKQFLKNKKLVTPMGTLMDAGDPSTSGVKPITPEVQFAILQACLKMWDAVRTIKNQVILREQMDYAEDSIERMFNVAEQTFCAFMECHEVHDYLLSIKYLSFTSFIELAKEKLIRKYRTMCKENHFVEKSNEDFREYLSNNTQLLTDCVKQLCKKHFQYKSDSPSFAKELERLYPSIQDTLTRCLEQARDIALKKHDEITEHKSTFMKAYEELTGTKLPQGFLDI